MDAEIKLPLLGSVCHAVYVPYAAEIDAELLALGIASIFSNAVKVFSVESDLLTPEQGQELAKALTGASTVIIYGPSNSKLIQAIAHHWPDYVEHCSNWSGSIVRNVTLAPTKDRGKLASVYLLIPTLTDAHRSSRPGVLRLSPDDVHRLISKASQSGLPPYALGYVYTGVSMEISMKDLCLLHERDIESAGTKFRSWREMTADSSPLTWADLQRVLRGDPEHSIIDHFRVRLTPEKYAFGHSAVDFISRFQAEMEGEVFPDIYSAVWIMEQAFQPGTVFRGQFQSKWGLESSLLRPPKNGAALDVLELTKRIHLTSRFLSEAKKLHAKHFDGAIDDHSLLAVAQHFGFPTPLLDFTESFTIAAFFATLGAQDPKCGDGTIGIIFYNTAPLEQQFAPADRGDAMKLDDLAGVRVGSLHVIRPNLPYADDRIRRQRGVFIAGYHARDLQAVSIDRVYFKQQPGVTFQDPKSGVSEDVLLPDNTALVELARKVKDSPTAVAALGSSLLEQTKIGDSSVIGSAGAHLYWHLRFGQQFLRELQRKTAHIGATALSKAIEDAVSQYFAFAHVEATVSTFPDDKKVGMQLVPIQKTIAALETAAGLPEDEIWRLLADQMPQGFQAGGIVRPAVPENWPMSARLAFSCAMYCVAWEHLRHVSGLRAKELVQSATIHLHGL